MYHTISSETENKLEKLYLYVSFISLGFAVIVDVIIILCIGFSSFSLLQCIGIILVTMVIASGILSAQKKSIALNLLKKIHKLQLDTQQNPQTELTDNSLQEPDDLKNIKIYQQLIQQYTEWLNQRITDFELTQNLVKTYFLSKTSSQTSQSDTQPIQR